MTWRTTSEAFSASSRKRSSEPASSSSALSTCSVTSTAIDTPPMISPDVAVQRRHRHAEGPIQEGSGHLERRALPLQRGPVGGLVDPPPLGAERLGSRPAFQGVGAQLATGEGTASHQPVAEVAVEHHEGGPGQLGQRGGQQGDDLRVEARPRRGRASPWDPTCRAATGTSSSRMALAASCPVRGYPGRYHSSVALCPAGCRASRSPPEDRPSAGRPGRRRRQARLTVVRSSPSTTSPSKWAAASARHSSSWPGGRAGHVVGEHQDRGTRPGPRWRRPARRWSGSRGCPGSAPSGPGAPCPRGARSARRRRRRRTGRRARRTGCRRRRAPRRGPRARPGSRRWARPGRWSVAPTITRASPMVSSLAGGHLDHVDRGRVVQVVVVGQAVADVGGQHRQHPVDHLAGAGRAVDRERVGHRAHHPAGGDHVVEVGEVVAVEVGEQHGAEHPREGAGRGQAHEHAPAGVDEQQGAARPARGWRDRPGRGRARAIRCPAG